MAPTKRKGLPTSREAEAIGLQALVFLTEEQPRLMRFLANTGLQPSQLGEAAGQPEMLLAVLDHLLSDESLLMVFAAGSGHDPAIIEPARAVLAGSMPNCDV